MKRVIVGTLDFLGHVYALLLIVGGAILGYERFGPVGLLGGLAAGLFITSMTVGLLFLLLEMNHNLRRLVELLEQEREKNIRSGGG